MPDRTNRPDLLITLSILAWAVGSVILAITLWQDAHRSGSGDVAAGLAGLALLVGLGVFAVCTGIGVVLGIVASRRTPDRRAADVALGLNVVSLAGVAISALILFSR